MRPIKKPLPGSLQNYALGDTVHREDIQNALVDTLGNYCSYCEMPLGGHQIEHHKRFKSWQITVLAGHWNDLLLICKDCRDHITKEELSEDEKKALLWPDEHVTFSLNGGSPFIYQQRQMRYMVLNDQDVHADETRKLVFIVPNPAAGPELFQKAKNTIDHFQLNMTKDYYTEGSDMMVVPLHHHNQVTDNRLFERSRTWDEAEAAFDRLKQITDHPDSAKHPEIIEMMHDQVSATAFFKGNWSVWMTVFSQLSGGTNDALLHRLFVKDQRYFKGVDTPNLGLNF